MPYETIKSEKKDHKIALITMIREAEMNTLSLEMMAEMEQALIEARKDPEVRCVIITGQGRVFCCGAHLRYFTQERPFGLLESRDYLIRVQSLFDSIEALEKPVIAAINGFALGGGAEMAMASDFRIMSEGARFGVPEILLGALAGAGGVQRLPRLIGRGRAIEMNMLGHHLSAQEADRFGLLYSRVPAQELLDASFALGRELAQKSPFALALIKSCIVSSENMSTKETMQLGLDAMLLCATSEYAHEGFNAFFEKREPKFEGLSFSLNR